MRRTIVTGVRGAATASVVVLALAACGGNLETAGGAGGEFPDGPVTVVVGQDPGGSTDLIGRAVAELASDELGVALPVENRPGANGAVASKEVADSEPDGQTVLVLNASLIAITSLVSPDDAVSLDDFTIITGISRDDYVLVTHPESGLATLGDIAAAGQTLDFATTGVGTGSQLSQQLLFHQMGVQGNDVPFDGGSPALTAVLGKQVDVASIQLGEAYPQIEAGELVPLVVFSPERNAYLPDVPTAVEEGYDVPVSQYRALAVPAGTPDETVAALRSAFEAAFADQGYQDFNEQALLTPHEISGEQVVEEWTAAKEKYESIIEEYDIDLGAAG